MVYGHLETPHRALIIFFHSRTEGLRDSGFVALSHTPHPTVCDALAATGLTLVLLYASDSIAIRLPNAVFLMPIPDLSD